MTTKVSPDVREARTGRPEDSDPSTLAALVKFAGAAAVLAMLSDAVIGHGLIWENDPYWTYWVTDTFLIATIFGLGSAWIGVGAVRGAVLTAVQTVVLTTYYWTFSPIGLPSHSQWLDLEHTWVTGPPVHFGVYYLGYLAALWLWRRRDRVRNLPSRPVARDAAEALAVGVGVVVAAGSAQAVILGEFPGVTWFVVRIIVATVFTMAWWTVAGRDARAGVGGGIALTAVLLAYGHYLGPVGIPETNLRLIARDSPPLDAHWLSYVDEWLIVLPITLLVSLGAYLFTATRQGDGSLRVQSVRRPLVVAGVVVAGLVGLGIVVAAEGAPDDHVATVTANGSVQFGAGPDFGGPVGTGSGEFHLRAQVRNPRVTPLPPHDRVELRAALECGGEVSYEITSDQLMITDPAGRFTTWGGVGFDKWHHGRSGVGSDAEPATRSDVIVFALADIGADGETIATGVPVHAMAVNDGDIELHVGDPASPVPGLPDGGLRVLWQGGDVDAPESYQRSANTFGSAVLLALIALVAFGLRRDEADPGRAETLRARD